MKPSKKQRKDSVHPLKDDSQLNLNQLELFLELSRNEPDMQHIIESIQECQIDHQDVLHQNMTILFLQGLGIYELLKEDDIKNNNNKQILQRVNNNVKTINRKLISFYVKDSINKNFKDNFQALFISLIQNNQEFLMYQLQNYTKFFIDMQESQVKEIRIASLEVLFIILSAVIKYKMQSEQKQQIKKVSKYICSIIINESLIQRLNDFHKDVQRMIINNIVYIYNQYFKKAINSTDNFHVFSNEENLFTPIFLNVLDQNNTMVPNYLELIYNLQKNYAENQYFKPLLEKNLKNIQYYSYSDDSKVMEYSVSILVEYLKQNQNNIGEKNMQNILDGILELLINQNKNVVKIITNYYYDYHQKTNTNNEDQGTIKKSIYEFIQIIKKCVKNLQQSTSFDILEHQNYLENIYEALDKNASIFDNIQEIYDLLFQNEIQDNEQNIKINNEDCIYILSIFIYLYKNIPKPKRKIYESLLLDHSTLLFNKFKLQLNENNNINVIQIFDFFQYLNIQDNSEAKKYIALIEIFQQIFFYTYNEKIITLIANIYNNFLALEGEVKSQILLQIKHIIDNTFAFIDKIHQQNDGTNDEQLKSHLMKLIIVVEKFGLYSEQFFTYQFIIQLHQIISRIEKDVQIYIELFVKLVQQIHSHKLKQILFYFVDDSLFIDNYLKIRNTFIQILAEYLLQENMQFVLEQDKKENLQIFIFTTFNQMVSVIGDQSLEKIAFLYFKFDQNLISILKKSIGRLIKKYINPNMTVLETQITPQFNHIIKITNSFMDCCLHHPQYIYSDFGIKFMSLMLKNDIFTYSSKKNLLRKKIRKGLKIMIYEDLQSKEQEKITILRLTTQLILKLSKHNSLKDQLTSYCRMIYSLYTQSKIINEDKRRSLLLFMADIVIQGFKANINVFENLKIFMNHKIFETEVLRKFLAFLQTELKKSLKDLSQSVISGGRNFQSFLEKECHIKIDEYIVEENESHSESEGSKKGVESEGESEMDLGKIVIK